KYCHKSVLPLSACAGYCASSICFCFLPSANSCFSAVVASGHSLNKALLHLRQPRRVAGHSIDFEIDIIPLAQFTKRRQVQSVRDNKHRKCVTFHCVDGK